ncbi:MAG: hypothetical protein IKP51_07230 [Treponema sp.]|nr:hypothetical protein [Treponema sp.]
MKKLMIIVIIIFICFFLIGKNILMAKTYSNIDYLSIEIDFYYNNSIVYTDTGRTITDILGGYYDIKNRFYYDDVKEFDSLHKLLNQERRFVYNEETQRMYETFVDSLCIVRLKGKLVLEFTYSESDDKYCLCNGDLIERNDIYDRFAKYLINKLDK